MKRSFLALLSACLVLVAGARAEVTFEVICDGLGTDISADATVVVGTADASLDYDTFRWTRQSGLVPLGQNPYLVFGTSAGTPAVSADGTQVAATILSLDGAAITQGRWTLGEGWQQTMPPPPPDGGIIDHAYGSCWGLSGDGTTVVGLYWRPGASDGGAHASGWTAAGGILDLGSSGSNSRANSCNLDGTVVVGWDQRPGSGEWRAAVWVDGELTVLSDVDGIGQADAVTDDGTIVVGMDRNPASSTREPAMWNRTENGWSETRYLGLIDGVWPDAGYMKSEAISADGSVVVGYCSFAGDPFYTTGFLWTEADGVVDVVDYLAANGVVPDPTLDIQSLQGISADGRVILGIAQLTVAPFTRKCFLIHRDPATAAPDIADPARTGIALQVWPNPVHGGGTRVALDLSRPLTGTLRIYDLAGRRVRDLRDGGFTAGSSALDWDGRDATGRTVPSGVYLAVFAAGPSRQSHKIIMAR